MQHEVEEKPKASSQEEAPARHLVSAVLNAVSKQNGGRPPLQTENSPSMVLIQQQQQQQQAAAQLNNITGTASPVTSIAGLTGASSSGSEYGNMYHHVSMDNADDDGYDDSRDCDELREQDRFLPIANVARIMKKAIPETGKIAKDAKECVQECVSEFISFITSEASERCQQEKRKTINGEDILCAMTNLGFDNYAEPLKVYLTKYRESLKGEKVLVSDYGQAVEGEDGTNMQHTLQYQVGNTLQPTMVSADGTYAYTQAQVSQMQQGLHFNG